MRVLFGLALMAATEGIFRYYWSPQCSQGAVRIAGGVWWLRRGSLKAAEITRGLNDADGIPMIEDKGL